MHTIPCQPLLLVCLLFSVLTVTNHHCFLRLRRRLQCRPLMPCRVTAAGSGWLLRQVLLQGAADHHRQAAPVYRPGQKVWLPTKDLPLQVLSRKPAPRFVGPFPVAMVINAVSVRLRLPRSLQVNPTFHVSKVKSPLTVTFEQIAEKS